MSLLRTLEFLLYGDVITWFTSGQILAFLGWYFNFITADIFMMCVSPLMFVKMWSSQSREKKLHLGIFFMQCSVLFGAVMNALAVISFRSFYIKQYISIIYTSLCFLSILSYILIFAWNAVEYQRDNYNVDFHASFVGLFLYFGAFICFVVASPRGVGNASMLHNF